MSRIIEVGLEIENQSDFDFLDELLCRCGFRYYFEPPNKYVSLEDLECACEGK